MIGATYIVRAIVALAIAWWLGAAIATEYVQLAGTVQQVREKVDHAIKRYD